MGAAQSAAPGASTSSSSSSSSSSPESNDKADDEITTTKMSRGVLHNKMAGGPKGLGNPNDRSLRKVEKEVLIMKIVRERAKNESDKCGPFKKEFDACSLQHQGTIVFYCREENRKLWSCMDKWYHNADFIAECTEQYLQRRSEFRRTGEMQRDYSSKIGS